MNCMLLCSRSIFSGDLNESVHYHFRIDHTHKIKHLYRIYINIPDRKIEMEIEMEIQIQFNNYFRHLNYVVNHLIITVYISMLNGHLVHLWSVSAYINW